MAIFSRMGLPLTITGYCGTHPIAGFAEPVELLEVRYQDGRQGYKFAHTLKADGGVKEIDDAVDAARDLGLVPEKLRTAIKEAK